MTFPDESPLFPLIEKLAERGVSIVLPFHQFLDHARCFLSVNELRQCAQIFISGLFDRLRIGPCTVQRRPVRCQVKACDLLGQSIDFGRRKRSISHPPGP